MTLRPYKFVVQAVVQQVDDGGNVVAEPTADPVILFGCDSLSRWASEFTDKLADAEPGTSE